MGDRGGGYLGGFVDGDVAGSTSTRLDFPCYDLSLLTG